MCDLQEGAFAPAHRPKVAMFQPAVYFDKKNGNLFLHGGNSRFFKKGVRIVRGVMIIFEKPVISRVRA